MKLNLWIVMSVFMGAFAARYQAALAAGASQRVALAQGLLAGVTAVAALLDIGVDLLMKDLAVELKAQRSDTSSQ